MTRNVEMARSAFYGSPRRGAGGKKRAVSIISNDVPGDKGIDPGY